MITDLLQGIDALPIFEKIITLKDINSNFKIYSAFKKQIENEKNPVVRLVYLIINNGNIEACAYMTIKKDIKLNEYKLKTIIEEI